MITSYVDVGALKELGGRLLTLQQADSLLRLISEGMLGATRERIHEEGKNSTGGQIGTYSPSYLELRIENRLSADPKVKLFFTGQMQNDYKIVPLSDTEYGLGFSNQLNADKADWAEDRFGKIYELTDQEMQGVRDIVSEYIKELFK